MVEGGEITVITVVNKAFRDGWGSLDEKKKKKKVESVIYRKES